MNEPFAALIGNSVATNNAEVHFVKMGLDAELGNNYLERLKAHISAVQAAGEKLGLPAEQMRVHDISKFNHDEFLAYALHFSRLGPRWDLFAPAFAAHVHRNPHHWQHWIAPGDGWQNNPPAGSTIKNRCFPMPEHFALEMIADWMGASMVYSETDDMTDWLRDNLPRIQLHPATVVFVRNTLIDLGYSELVAELHQSNQF